MLPSMMVQPNLGAGFNGLYHNHIISHDKFGHVESQYVKCTKQNTQYEA